MNLATILVALVVAAVFAAILVREVKKRKNGAGCGCGCAGCANAGLCHPKRK